MFICLLLRAFKDMLGICLSNLAVAGRAGWLGWLNWLGWLDGAGAGASAVGPNRAPEMELGRLFIRKLMS